MLRVCTFDGAFIDISARLQQVCELKHWLSSWMQCPSHHIHIVYSGKTLADYDPLSGLTRVYALTKTSFPQ